MYIIQFFLYNIHGAVVWDSLLRQNNQFYIYSTPTKWFSLTPKPSKALQGQIRHWSFDSSYLLRQKHAV